ncbi:hypothetical protein [Pantoea ananatis]|uniref:hypothetical protein n=1 Tax=Pantoea ananas TaxID=553 RepID=UPI0005A5139B|nr:hypothetical protein [Pantoea ananatis]
MQMLETSASGTKQTFGLNFHQASILTMKVGSGILTAGSLLTPVSGLHGACEMKGLISPGLGVGSLLLTLRGVFIKAFSHGCGT